MAEPSPENLNDFLFDLIKAGFKTLELAKRQTSNLRKLNGINSSTKDRPAKAEWRPIINTSVNGISDRKIGALYEVDEFVRLMLAVLGRVNAAKIWRDEGERTMEYQWLVAIGDLVRTHKMIVTCLMAQEFVHVEIAPLRWARARCRLAGLRHCPSDRLQRPLQPARGAPRTWPDLRGSDGQQLRHDRFVLRQRPVEPRRRAARSCGEHRRRSAEPAVLTQVCHARVLTVAFGRGVIRQMISPQANKRGATSMTTKAPNVAVSDTDALLALTITLPGKWTHTAAQVQELAMAGEKKLDMAYLPMSRRKGVTATHTLGAPRGSLTAFRSMAASSRCDAPRRSGASIDSTRSEFSLSRVVFSIFQITLEQESAAVSAMHRACGIVVRREAARQHVGVHLPC